MLTRNSLVKKPKKSEQVIFPVHYLFHDSGRFENKNIMTPNKSKQPPIIACQMHKAIIKLKNRDA